mmetsp:Transcript_68172/g.137131  ORF Transcript_68172/g.137131 Transcript_68172/m.137131 type:complete len:229 (-) Transcript_68172:153-839(-)
MMHLRGKVALVTGSTSGIGLGIARVLASRGADLIINGLEGAVTAQHIIDDLERVHNVKVAYSDADIRNPDQIAEMMALAPEKFDGRNVSVLVNNAGIQHVSSIENFELEAWRRVLEINLTSNFLTIKAALPSMRAARWGRIINVASVHGRVASVNKSAYVASKHGVVGLTRAVALEAAGSGVTCNAICPGWVLTPLVQTQIEARALLRVGRQSSAGGEAALGGVCDAH